MKLSITGGPNEVLVFWVIYRRSVSGYIWACELVLGYSTQCWSVRVCGRKDPGMQLPDRQERRETRIMTNHSLYRCPRGGPVLPNSLPNSLHNSLHTYCSPPLARIHVLCPQLAAARADISPHSPAWWSEQRAIIGATARIGVTRRSVYAVHMTARL